MTERQRALCEYAVKLTRTPAAMTEADLAPLRQMGLSDRDIHDAVQVISYFNYINRLADALSVDPEPEMRAAWQQRQANLKDKNENQTIISKP